MRNSREIIGFGILLVAILGFAADVLADVTNPVTFTVEGSSTRTLVNSNKTNAAIAGNVTQITIDNTQITQGWQGYYGNITGTIVLDDANNNSMYTWSLADTGGEVYASRNHSISWASGDIVCADVANVSEENSIIFPGSASDDNDNITETFSLTTHPTIVVGANTITADSCQYSLATYVDDASDSGRRFNETLLYSKSKDAIIYTAIISQDGDGFKNNNQLYDFQMLVGEDGHSDSTTTTYYFYVELDA